AARGRKDHVEGLCPRYTADTARRNGTHRRRPISRVNQYSIRVRQAPDHGAALLRKGRKDALLRQGAGQHNQAVDRQDSVHAPWLGDCPFIAIQNFWISVYGRSTSRE